MMETTGIILAGGRSLRFGTNKSLALYQNEPLISHVANCLESLFSELLLVTNEPDDFSFLNWPMISDQYKGRGPLAGIHAALKKIKTKQGFIVGCDMPLLSSDLISSLCSLSGEWKVALPWLPSGPEPLHAVYRKEISDFLELELEKGHNKITDILISLPLRIIRLEEIKIMGGDESNFYNINRKKDLDDLVISP